MKNKFTDLNNHLFAQLERLGEENLQGEKLETELERSKAINQIATQIISTGRLVLDAEIAKQEHQLKFIPNALVSQHDNIAQLQ